MTNAVEHRQSNSNEKFFVMVELWASSLLLLPWVEEVEFDEFSMLKRELLVRSLAKLLEFVEFAVEDSVEDVKDLLLEFQQNDLKILTLFRCVMNKETIVEMSLH